MFISNEMQYKLVDTKKHYCTKFSPNRSQFDSEYKSNPQLNALKLVQKI